MIKAIRNLNPSPVGYYRLTALMLAVPLLLLWLSRFAFAAYNADLVGYPSTGRLFEIALGGLRFDLSAWAYFNTAFIVMRLFPARFVFSRGYMRVGKIIYCIANFIMLSLALGDIPFFRFSGSRLRQSALADMLHDPEILSILGSYAASYWWAFLIGLLMLALLIGLCLIPAKDNLLTLRSKKGTIVARIGLFVVAAALTLSAMRGNLGPGKPIAIADAVWYTEKPAETNLVLNTPFCVLRSAKGGDRVAPMEFMNADELSAIRSSVKNHAWPADSFTRRNVVVITIESGSLYWLDRFNDVKADAPRGLMPFLDSLSTASLVNTHVMATGKRSIEGLTAIYGGFPTFGDMLFMSSPYNANTIDAFPRLLAAEGYDSRFYFGGNRGSYSINSFARAMGFKDVADRDTYADDSDYDGSWGIFDHAMARFAALDISRLKPPFVAGWFTINLHPPYAVPADWRPDGYRNPANTVYRSAEYTDRSLRRFFEIARTQPWYANTIFVITGDHGNRDLKGTPFDGGYVQPHVMFLIYAPDGSVAPGVITDRVMSQIDISPTILSLLRYPRPYVALGTDMLATGAPRYATGYFNSQYVVTGPRYMVRLTDDLQEAAEVFDVAADPQLTRPLDNYDRTEVGRMILWNKAFMQDYTQRLNSDSLHI